MGKTKESKGSITLFVLIAMLFFIIFLISIYAASINRQSLQLGASERQKDIYENGINNVDEIYNKSIKTDSQKPMQNELGISPDIQDGMIPIKYNAKDDMWYVTTVSDSNWFNYKDGKWANIMLSDGKYKAGEVEDGQQIKNDELGSMFVYIPAYAYRITNGYHKTSTSPAIDVKFVSYDSENGKYICAYDSSINIMEDNSSSTSETDYILEPAFIFGDVKVNGIWVAKYEASNLDNTIKIKKGVTSWTNISPKDAFNNCLNMKLEGNVYNINQNITDTHLMKNIEWGACSYLAQSEYGKNSKLGLNHSDTMITGTGGTGASTTGNVYGIYDMSGGAWEYVAACMSSDAISKFETNDSKYIDLYTVYDSSMYGDAMYETSGSSSSSSDSWYNEQAWFNGSGYVIARGGYYNNGSEAGIFCFYGSKSEGDLCGSFRPVIVRK